MSVHFTHQLEHLDLIASAPEGVKRLRELILELAVRGKLVPQDPNDEPASELLKRIQAEKAKLVTEGRIKKDKPLPEIGEEEKAFELPVGWEWTYLGTLVSNMDAGWSPACHDHASPTNEIWGVLRTTAVQAITYLEYENKELPQHLTPKPEYEVRAGDILITRAGPKNRVGISCLVQQTRPHLMISDKIIRFHLLGDMPFDRYVSLCLNAGETAQYLEAAKSGMAESQMNISQVKLRRAPIPLPPASEQHRIVAKVDELMAFCDRLEAQQTDAASAHTTLVKTLLDTLTLPNHLLSHASAQRPDRSGRPVRSATGPGSGHDQTPISPSQSANDFTTNWRRLAQHFDTLITTEASVTALKQTLLQLAVMGKLVPQDPNDEPASELLKRIQAEKAKLVAEGKIKKDKPLAKISEEEKPFELPERWEWVRLCSLGITSTGKTPSTSNLSFYGGLLPFIGPGQISKSGQIADPEKWLSEVARTETSIAQPEDILMVCIGGSIGKSASVDCEVAFNQQINCIRPVVASSKYIHISMANGSFQQSVIASSTGSATPIINRSKWEEIPVSLPPLAEQHRIVAKVDELMALCDHLASRFKAARELSAKYATVVTETALESAAGHAAIA